MSRARRFASRSAHGPPSPAERRLRARGAILAATALLAVLVAAATVAPAAAAGASSPRFRHDQVLSDETTSTSWSIAALRAPIRSRPSPHARQVGRLRWATPDGFQQTYLLLRERLLSRQSWVLLRIPGRPNGRVGWARRSDLDRFHVLHTAILVDREAARLTVFRHGKTVFQAPVGTGKPSTPTPAGRYWLTEEFPSSDPFYGPWVFGTSDYSALSTWANDGVVGLHGTNQPELIPGHPSHGCIRLRNRDIIRLKHLVQIGTPLRVV